MTRLINHYIFHSIAVDNTLGTLIGLIMTVVN